jgi:osmotically-inducible protein OsmY
MNDIEKEIKQRVVQQLYWDDRIDTSDITVEVQDRKVILKGTVGSYLAHEAAETTTSRVRDVELIDNHLKVKYSHAPPLTDSDLESRANELLEWNPEIDTTKIQATVKNRIASLKGSVDSYWKRTTAMQLISRIAGIEQIRDQIAVVPTEASSDEAIAKVILAALDRNSLVNVEYVTITVKDGVVTLEGIVPHYEAYQATLNTAELTRGVVDIKNNLKIGLEQAVVHTKAKM